MQENSYYDQIMNQDNMDIFNNNNLYDFQYPAQPIEPIIELKNEKLGKSIRLDRDILAINLTQPWAYCIVHELCKVFCFKSAFEVDKYPNGYWYAIRVHASRVCMLSISQI